MNAPFKAEWAQNFAEMWERLWDYLIYPILKILGYEIESPYPFED